MKNVTKKLMLEHQLILKYIDLLMSYLKEMTADEQQEGFLYRLENFVDFIQNYADKYHHAKEENILFKFMEEPEVLSHCNPLPVMLYEHDEGRKYIKNVLDALKNNNKAAAIENAAAWAQLLREHIYKEDNILYPMAEEGLKDKQKENIISQYNKVEISMKGEELEQKYSDLYNLLKTSLSSKSHSIDNHNSVSIRCSHNKGSFSLLTLV
jgi:hemerythrin-like domain-containing protein